MQKPLEVAVARLLGPACLGETQDAGVVDLLLLRGGVVHVGLGLGRDAAVAEVHEKLAEVAVQAGVHLREQGAEPFDERFLGR